MKYALSILTLALVVVACANTKELPEENKNAMSEFKNISEEDSLFASIKRGFCYGTCPVYEMKIYNSGYTTLEGTRNIELIGKYTTTIIGDQMRALLEKAMTIGYMDMEDSYDNSSITDLPESTTSIVVNGKRKQVLKRYGYPKALSEFEKMFDELLTSEEWHLDISTGSMSEAQCPILDERGSMQCAKLNVKSQSCTVFLIIYLVL